MKQVWVMIGLGVTVAAGAAVLLPSRSAPPAEESVPESTAPPVLASRPIEGAPANAEAPTAPVVHNNFAPIDRTNVPSMRNRQGPMHAPEPPRTAEARRPVIPAANEPAVAREIPKPVPVTPAPATATTTGTPRHMAGRNAATNQPQATAAAQAAQQQLEQRRQDLENARRQRLLQAQVRAPGGSIAAANQRSAAANTSQNAGENASASNNNGAPSLEDILSQNPWLRDYAPGGRLANSTGTRNNSTGTTRNPTGSNNGSNTGGDTGGSTGSSGSSGGAGGGTVVSGNGGTLATATVASVKWVPLDNRACGSTLAGFRTNDLYVRLDAQAPVLGLSTEENPLTIVGGSFFQASGTGDTPPTAGALAASPCTQFDTYLHSTGASGFSLLGGTTANPVFTPTRVAGSLFNFSGVIGAQDSAKFGDDGYYVWFGRFTAPTSITGLTGKLAVETGVPGTTSFRSFLVDLTLDSTVWTFNASFGLPGSAGGGGSAVPGAFGLTLPAASATEQPLMPVLAWSAATGAVDYEVTVDTDAAFTLPNTHRTTTTATTLVIPSATLVNGTVYHWRVIARNTAGTSSSTPVSASFTTLGTPPGGPPDDDGNGTPPGGNPPGGTPDPCASQAPGISAVWRPIDNGGCTDEEFEVNLSMFATADLYLRMATTNSQSTTPPFSLQFVSAEVTGSPPVVLGNGMFFQHDAGGNTRPAASQVASVPCLAFDTYYAIDTGATEAPAANAPTFQPLPQLILPPGIGAFTATGIRGLWVVSGFGASSALPAAKDSARFPNDPCGYYVRIGRFTISRGATLGGTMLVAFVLPGTGTTTTAEVTVPNCTACWQ